MYASYFSVIMILQYFEIQHLCNVVQHTHQQEIISFLPEVSHSHLNCAKNTWNFPVTAAAPVKTHLTCFATRRMMIYWANNIYLMKIHFCGLCDFMVPDVHFGKRLAVCNLFQADVHNMMVKNVHNILNDML